MNDQDYMRRAIDLAKRGAGWTSPNPLVGAVIVKDGRVIGEGWHEKCGELHAERNALKQFAHHVIMADNFSKGTLVFRFDKAEHLYKILVTESDFSFAPSLFDGV